MQFALCAARQQIVIGYKHTHASGRVDGGTVPPAVFGGLDDTPRVRVPVICTFQKGHNGNLPVMREHLRTLVARKRGDPPRRVNDERNLESIDAAVTTNINLPDCVASFCTL